MEQSHAKEFRVEYTIRYPEEIYGNFEAFGNPFDREDILNHIAFHAWQRTGEPVNWDETLGLTYEVKETARLLDSAWNSLHGGSATAGEMLELLHSSESSRESSKIERMRKMHRQEDG